MGEVYVGVAGWSYADWRGTVYPREGSRLDELAYLSRFFRVIEVNSSFYHIPTTGRTSSWVRRVTSRDRFLFTIKAWQGFTHGELGSWGGSEIKLFREALRPLADGGRLGAVLLQFPWHFAYGEIGRERVSRAVGALLGFPLVVEFRHRSWIESEGLAYLEGLGVSISGVDQPESRTSLPRRSFSLGDVGYIRLHGRNRSAWFDRQASRDAKYDYLYEGSELQEWVQEIRSLARKMPRTFVIANNHYRGQAPANALQLFSMLAGRPVEVPRVLAETYPQLSEIRREPDAGLKRSLFE